MYSNSARSKGQLKELNMNNLIKQSEQVRTLSVIIGTAFQRSILRLSNLVLAGAGLIAMFALPSALLLPLLLATIFILAGNIFLGATDQETLTDLIDEFDNVPTELLKLPQVARGVTGDSGQGKLKGKHRELYQKLVKSRKELDTYLHDGKGDLPGVMLADLDGRLDSLSASFRVLAVRGSLLSDFTTRHPYKALIKEAVQLEKKAETAGSAKATEDYTRAAADKRGHAEKLGIVITKVEDIEAKLHHIITTVEGYTVMIATSGSADSDRELVAKVEKTLGGLKAETEALDEVMKLIGA